MMIELYSWPTPNGHKIHIMLEECALPYRVHAIDITQGDQFSPAFLAISPNNKIPALTDTEGPGNTEAQPFALFESGAILIYLAEKVNKFFPQEPLYRYQVLQWLMFQMGGVGPMIGQAHHFINYAPEKIEYAVSRYTNEAKRLYGIMNFHLQTRAYFVAEQYTIADMAIYPWLRSWERLGIHWTDFPHLKRWFDTIEARPAVLSGSKVLSAYRKPIIDDKARENLFGKTQYAKRGSS